MGTFQRTERYSVRVANFDRQQQTFIPHGSEMPEAPSCRLRQGRCGQGYAALIAYTATHFAAEEAAMEKNGYGDQAEKTSGAGCGGCPGRVVPNRRHV